MTVTEILDRRRQFLVQRRERYIKRRQVADAQDCTARPDELAEIETLLELRPDRLLSA